MAHSASSSTSAMKALDDKLVFKAHNDKTNFSRNTKRACAVCGPNGGNHAEGRGLKVCSRCKRLWYCSSECQKKDWKRHKEFCNMHQNNQAALDQDAQAVAASATPSGVPSIAVLYRMLEDFANLHHRVVSVVLGHEFGTHSNAFPPLDVNEACVVVIVKLRNPDLNPASIYEFTGGVASVPIDSLNPEQQKMITPYAKKLSKDNVECAAKIETCFIPTWFIVENPPVAYLTTVELRRGQLDVNLLKRTVPENAPWWAQLEYNAEKGLVVRRHWNDRLQTYVELLGTMKEKGGGSWRWEKVEDSRGNKKAEEELRERRKLLRK